MRVAGISRLAKVVSEYELPRQETGEVMKVETTNSKAFSLCSNEMGVACARKNTNRDKYYKYLYLLNLKKIC